MDASSHTRRLGSRALAHGTYAKGVSDGELVARRISRLARECCSSTVVAQSQPPITDPLAIVFTIDQSRAVRTMNLSLMGSGVILNGSTQVRFSGSYTQNIIAASIVSVYSSDLSDCLFSFESPTYYTVTGYYLPKLLRAGMVTDIPNNKITSIKFTQVAPKLDTFSTYVYDYLYRAQPFQFSVFDCSGLPALRELVLQNVSGPFDSIINAPSTLRNLYLGGNALSGNVSIPLGIEIFSVFRNPIQSITNLSPTLKELYLSHTLLTGTLNLASMPALQVLDIEATTISHLTNLPSTLKTLEISETDISGNFDLAGLSNLTKFNASTSWISSLSNIPTTLKDIGLNNANLDQSAADSLAAALVTNGATGGRLIIEYQKIGKLIINEQVYPYKDLIDKGWKIFKV